MGLDAAEGDLFQFSLGFTFREGIRRKLKGTRPMAQVEMRFAPLRCKSHAGGIPEDEVIHIG